MAAADELDAFLFDIAVRDVRSMEISFADKALAIAAKSAGKLICNVRVDADPEFQRIAVIRFPREGIGILALGKDGLSIGSCTANGAFSSFIEPLAEWHVLSLRDQAVADIRGHVSLFAGALRKAGHVPILDIALSPRTTTQRSEQQSSKLCRARTRACLAREDRTRHPSQAQPDPL